MRHALQSTAFAAALALAASPALAQSVNIRLTGIGNAPSSTFGAAIGQSGVWNKVVHGTYPVTAPATPLLDLDGQPTDAEATIINCDAEPRSSARSSTAIATRNRRRSRSAAWRRDATSSRPTARLATRETAR
jgi:hypothetical protein